MKYDYEKQHKGGKLHARERIDQLVDRGSFFEIGSGISHSSLSPFMKGRETPYDGVITGFGSIGSVQVAVFSQDFTVMGGSLGYRHGQKIAKLIKMALELRCPLIGIGDSGGARIQEGVDSLAGYGEIFYYNTLASGVIPQISIIVGPCAGGAVYSPGISDFIFVVDGISNMFVTGPKVVKSVLFEDYTMDELGGAKLHAEKSGVAHFRSPDEKSCFTKVRKLVGYLEMSTPNENLQSTRRNSEVMTGVKVEVVMKTKLSDIVPQDPKRTYDVKSVITTLSPHFIEVHEGFAQNIVVGFGHIGGQRVGIVANQPAVTAGVIDNAASVKAARFVRFCDAFGIPLLSLCDVPGFLPGYDQESGGIIRNGAKLLYAFSEATVPKVNVIMRKAYGGAYIAMNSKHIGADFVFAWPKAEIAVMGADGAVEILYGRELAGDESGELKRKLVGEYATEYLTPNYASRSGYVDEIIDPDETESKVIAAFEILKSKTSSSPYPKKHGNIPL